jgi:nuclear pore complex protein Nup188
MHLFHSRQTGTPSSIGNLVDRLDHYFRFAVGVPSLNSSLHTQLKRNFEARYPGCTPQDLKRTSLEDRHVGKDYFYDLPLADKMLHLDQAWTGRKNDGLRVEFETANVNLSLVDAQIVSQYLIRTVQS